MNRSLMLGIVLLLVVSMFVVANATSSMIPVPQGRPPYDPNGDLPSDYEPPLGAFNARAGRDVG